jgi:hypothetical protein
MKLTDFYQSAAFNSLRRKMGASLIKDIKLQAKKHESLSLEQIQALASEGLEVYFSDCSENPDGTINFRGKRVIVYIRDKHMYRGDFKLPKFHLSWCKTLRNQVAQNRYSQKYVVSTRDDGYFSLNIFKNEGNREFSNRQARLKVCRQCLEGFGWEGFRSSGMTENAKNLIESEFKISKFFEKYPRDLISVIPNHNSDTAPLDDYTDDFPIIRERLLRLRGRSCESCSIVGVELHVHHKNGVKYDNSETNLEILCVPCHKAHHSHM